MDNEMIHVAVAFHDAKGQYARHVGVTLASVWANATRPVCIHVLHNDTLTAPNRLNLERIALDFGQRIFFYPVRLPESLPGFDDWGLTVGSFYRLLLPQVLPFHKVIYFDCDLIAEMDVAELWDKELKGLPVAAVHDQGIPRWTGASRRQVEADGISLSAYFNSGVMILDLYRIRKEHDLPGELAEYLQHGSFSDLVDQDFMNYVFQNQCCWMDDQYNRLVSYIPDSEVFAERKPSVWHFAGGKPWRRHESAWDLLYWKYLLLTPWRSMACEEFAFMNQERQRILSSRCWRLMAPYRAIGDWARKKGWI